MARRARRTFTPEFEARAVLDVLTGTATQAEVCRNHPFPRCPNLVADLSAARPDQVWATDITYARVRADRRRTGTPSG